MPLEDDEWSKGKCGFKGLQYMALGIPAILSPVGVNTSIIQDGVNGFLCSTAEEWKSQLIALFESNELRERIGSEGYKTILDRYSVQANLPHYKQLFQS